MATLYQVNKNFQGVNGFGTPFCSQIYTAALTANTDISLTVPTNAAMGMAPAQTTNNTFIVVFSYAPSAKVWVSVNGTPAVPAAGTFGASTSELNPPAKICKAGDTIHMLCVAGADVSAAFYSTQEN